MSIPNFLLSSTGEGIAMRWKAIASSIIPVFVLLAPSFGLQLDPDFQDQLTNNVTVIITSAWAFFSAVAFMAGLVRRNFNKTNRLGKFAQ